MDKLRFIDLFAVSEGFARPRERACLRFSSDLDPDARLTYGENFGRNRRATLREFRRLTSPVTICSAGLPLSTFQHLGEPSGFEDAQGTLLYEILRRPPPSPGCSFLENVKNFSAMPMGIETTLELLESLGYEVHYSVLNTSATGWLEARAHILRLFPQDLGVSGFQFRNLLTKAPRSSVFPG